METTEEIQDPEWSREDIGNQWMITNPTNARPSEAIRKQVLKKWTSPVAS